MINSMLNHRAKTNKELLEIIEPNQMVIDKYYNIAVNDNLKDDINIIINEKKDNWILQLQNIMSNEESKEIKAVDDSLILLKKLCFLCGDNVEKESILYKVSSLDELYEIYQKTVFCLRRMEFDMSDEDCIIFLKHINAWKLSTEFIVMVILEGAIYNKSRVANRLMCILNQNGYRKLADNVKRLIIQKQNTGL